MSESARPSVSVLVSSYNYAAYVVEAIESALAQCGSSDQVIVVDDGSSDGSPALLQRRFGQEPRVRLIAQSNQGQLAAWMAGFVHATGDIVALLDSDDLWEPDYLRSILAVYQTRPEIDFVYTNMQYFDQRQGPMNPSGPDRDMGLSMLLGAYVQRWQGTATSAISLRRGLAARLLALPPDMAAQWKSRPDDCLVYGADILGAHKFYLGTPLVRHRQHGANAKNAYRNAALQNYRHLVRSERMLEFYRQQVEVTPQWMRMAKAEFRTKPSPRFAELRAYRWLLGQARLPWWKRIEQDLALWAHYFKGRRHR
ncbi:MAG TPA: glycosyltransferase family 2 protein [Pseudoxanthomonas sp.]|nr:glycosyltransferase family 2 protein [Pseudoxanthomonas sp.]